MAQVTVLTQCKSNGSRNASHSKVLKPFQTYEMAWLGFWEEEHYVLFKRKKCFRGEQNNAEVPCSECYFYFFLRSDVWEICKREKFGKKLNNSHLVRSIDLVNITQFPDYFILEKHCFLYFKWVCTGCSIIYTKEALRSIVQGFWHLNSF